MTLPPLAPGLRARILLLVVLAALLPSAVVTGFLFQQRGRDIALARANLSALARGAADDLHSRIQGSQQLLFGLAQSRELDGADRNACSEYLGEVRKQYPQYTGIITITPNGDLHCDSLKSGRQLNLSDRAYFKHAMASSGPVLEPAFGRLSGLGVLQVARAARDASGQVRFVLLASINLDQFATEVLKVQPYADMVVTLYDRAGAFLAISSTNSNTLHVIKERLASQAAAKDPVRRFSLSGNDGDTTSFVGLAGMERVWALGLPPPALDSGVRIAIGVPTEALSAQAERRARLALALVVGATLLALLLAWLVANLGIAGPLRRIMVGTARFRNGEMDARIGPPYPHGEIGELMQSLDATSDTVQTQHQHIQSMNVGLEERVRARTAELEAVNRELQAFSYSLAHDLRQPLISINGFAARLRNARPMEAGSRPDHYMGRIEAGVCQINNLAEAMTALARLSRARLERSSVDVSAIANAALAACQQREPDRVVNFQVQEGLQTTADTALLTVAVERLIDNAWKFTREQARAEIRFGCEPGSDGTVVFHVKDNGLGFNMEYAGQLFSAFQNMHTPDGFSGSGIGLASAHKIITRHGGRIWAESAPGQGASFYFTLG